MYLRSAILMCLLFPVLLFSQKVEVCFECDIKTVQAAIDNAEEYDTIVIKKGTYKAHNILVNKPLTIIGENHPVIDGGQKGEVITIVSDDVTIDGLLIANVGTSYTADFAAIRVKKSKNFVIQNLILKNLFFGIYLEKARDGKVYNNKIVGDAVQEYSSGNGIQLWYCKNITIEKNHVSNVRDGIYLEFSDDCLIKNNRSQENLRYGLHFMFSNNDTYQENVFEKNGAGVAVMFSKNIKMLHNKFKNNWGTASYGLLLKEINDAEITGNTFEQNTIGINIEGSNRIVYQHNNFVRNGWAMKVRGACYNNHFIENNLLYNVFDLTYSSKANDNIFDRNYWSNYSGYDLNSDNIGDVPHRPVTLFSYVANKTPESIVLIRSLFVDIINFSEKVSPVFTPVDILDHNPSMKKNQW